jgi:hypothetical protein
VKRLLSILLVGILVALFAATAMVSETQSKPMLDCYLACNRTTYKLIECCPYIQHGEIDWKCHMVGWCYPE